MGQKRPDHPGEDVPGEEAPPAAEEPATAPLDAPELAPPLEEPEPLAPGPLRLAQLHRAVRSRRPRATPWQAVADLLRARVPAYQVALGAAAAAVLAFGSLNAPEPPLGADTGALPGTWGAPSAILTRSDTDEVLLRMRNVDGDTSGLTVDTLLSQYLSRHARPAVAPGSSM